MAQLRGGETTATDGTKKRGGLGWPAGHTGSIAGHRAHTTRKLVTILVAWLCAAREISV